ncbi:uncharacterized protein N7459_007434 [Penicillium hispanicum]|uniref:uncharacterized protein n=1 Tax=Penicillium hispanicum TaxID=1080232 RepID=UPI0025411807|nr:uncharacterized protein N7459_007434 [Penicillium hispanicum]KAJ5578470.1 hypothetical protein N7459_007434 [Penicillium hispanicum]
MSPELHDRSHHALCVEALPRKQQKWLSFLSLRFGTVLCSMVGIVCFAWAFSQHEAEVVYTDGIGAGLAVSNLGTASYGFVWSTIIFSIVFFGCAVHPGVSIAFDCIALISQIITAVWNLYELGFYHAGGYGDPGTQDDRLYGVECFGSTMLLLGVIFYVGLIVRASMVCHVQRRNRMNVKPIHEDV